MLPYVINFMLTQYAPPDIEKTLRSSDYLERILQLVFAFGFAFEMPVLLTLLIRVGIVSTEGLRSKRRYAIVDRFIVAAVLTPPDVVSQIALAIPLLALLRDQHPDRLRGSRRSAAAEERRPRKRRQGRRETAGS